MVSMWGLFVCIIWERFEAAKKKKPQCDFFRGRGVQRRKLRSDVSEQRDDKRRNRVGRAKKDPHSCPVRVHRSANRGRPTKDPWRIRYCRRPARSSRPKRVQKKHPSRCLTVLLHLRLLAHQCPLFESPIERFSCALVCLSAVELYWTAFSFRNGSLFLFLRIL